MNQIAVTLGFDGQWDPVDVGDYLDIIAGHIAATGRPDPGRYLHQWSVNESQHSSKLQEFARAHPVPHDRQPAGDWHVLNQIGRMLSGQPWQWFTLQDVAQQVMRSGRPHPGVAPNGMDYIDALNTWARSHDVPGVARDPFVGIPGPVTPGVASPGPPTGQGPSQGPGL